MGGVIDSNRSWRQDKIMIGSVLQQSKNNPNAPTIHVAEASMKNPLKLSSPDLTKLVPCTVTDASLTESVH
eukprot:4244431-Amphidinium_carterae.1